MRLTEKDIIQIVTEAVARVKKVVKESYSDDDYWVDYGEEKITGNIKFYPFDFLEDSILYEKTGKDKKYFKRPDYKTLYKQVNIENASKIDELRKKYGNFFNEEYNIVVNGIMDMNTGDCFAEGIKNDNGFLEKLSKLKDSTDKEMFQCVWDYFVDCINVFGDEIEWDEEWSDPSEYEPDWEED